VLEAYCDETESVAQGKPLLLLAGYAADADNWRVLSREWQHRILNRYGIPFFHAKELRSGNAKHYRHLSRHKRRALIEDATAIIADAGIEATGIIFLRPFDWSSVSTPAERAIFGSAYRIAAEYFMLGLCQNLGTTTFGSEPLVSVCLESGHPSATDAINGISGFRRLWEPIEMPECLQDKKVVGIQIGDEPPLCTVVTERPNPIVRMESCGVVNKRTVIPVQAADLLAYLSGAAIRNQVDRIFDGIWPLIIKG